MIYFPENINEFFALLKELYNKKETQLLRKAIDGFIQHYNSAFYKVVKKYKFQEDEIEDVIQEFWIKFYVRALFLQVDIDGWSWLIACAQNEALQYLRKEKRLKNLINFGKNNVEPEFLELYNHEELERLKEILMNAINNLPSRMKDVIFLYYVECKSFSEVAQKLNIEIDNVYSIRSQSIKKLRDNLALRRYIDD